MQALLIKTINTFVYSFLNYLMLIRVLLSWIPSLRHNAIGDLIYGLTEPILRPVRKMVDKSPLGGSMIDFSPIIALFLISIFAEILKEIVVIIF